MDVYGFNLEYGQKTGGLIWIYNDDERKALNEIVAGWLVSPEDYKDSKTHFTMDWFVGGEPSKGCIDMSCPGFQRTPGSDVVPGQAIDPVSSTSRGQQYITIRVSKDRGSNNWEIYYGFNGDAKIIGYYPKSLFYSLSYKPVTIMFGGFVYKYVRQRSPPMGSGIAPSRPAAASFRSMKLIDADGNKHPVDFDLTLGEQCFHATPIKYGMFFYGGPGNVC
uniref:Neprosin PEP catalytic domain-containing protein n=1 Tax=Leersia perrieri TaxID=77586 RepID=A0A0D9WVN9_9ORYZ